MTRTAARTFETARWIAILVFFSVWVTACGGDGASAPTVHAPTISNLLYSPVTATQQAGGTATINGSFDFSDAGGDVASMRITSSGGVDTTALTPQLAGITSGTAIGQIVVSIDQPGKYTFEIWVTDSVGTNSNRLTGTFEVVAALPMSHPPSIANLTYSPASIPQSAGGTVPVAGSVDFTDSGKDIARLELATSWGPTLSFPALDKQGLSSGTIQYAIDVPVSEAGAKTFEVVVFDAQGESSNRLIGTVNVVGSLAHVPVITQLTYAPSAVTAVPNGTASISWTVGLSDDRGDITRIRILGAGIDVWVDTPQLSGVTVGETSGTFAVSTSQLGLYTFEIWAIDSSGNTSNHVSGTLRVSASVQVDGWYGIARDALRYVVVGAGGNVMTSTDLLSWTPSVSGVTHLLRSVTASPGGFVAVGDGGGEAVILTSPDGVAWTVRYRAGQCAAGSCASPARLSKVIWAGTRFVALGDEQPSPDTAYALILASPDGINWTQHAARKILVGDPPFTFPLMTSITWSGSLFVAVGVDGTDLSPKAWRSANLEDWTAAGLGNEAVWSMPLGDIVWGHDRYVAVGGPGFSGHAPTFASIDAITWQTGPATPQLPPMSAVAAGSSGYMAVGDGYRQTSTDGLNWSVTPMLGCGKGILWDGARFVAVGQTICVIP
jgi:hypothetical protein